ncbi:MAG: hypothetical protein JKY34_07485, partial [Kordiimonadaceae bacterium]|nr:hypothetical protein [Kordiimonadaceae bacterium]
MNEEDMKKLIDSLSMGFGEAFHTSLRKYCDSNASGKAWKALNDLPPDEWSCCLEEGSKWALEVAKSSGFEMVNCPP